MENEVWVFILYLIVKSYTPVCVAIFFFKYIAQPKRQKPLWNGDIWLSSVCIDTLLFAEPYYFTDTSLSS